MNRHSHTFTLSLLAALSFSSSIVAVDVPTNVPAPAPTPVAKVGGTVITDEAMKKELGTSLYEAENNLYQIKKNWVDQQAKNILFDQAAKDAGISRQDWQAREIDAKTTAPSQAEIQEMTKRYPPDQANSAATLQQVTGYLSNQKRAQREQEIFQQLQQKMPVEILLAKPVAPHIEVAYGADDPVKGPKSAPITIIEFTDFQCPYCQRSQTTLREVEKAYGRKIKLVARQYPLPMHPRAKPASEAALCAKEQGKFWEYRDKLFEKQALEEADFKRYAQELKLNTKSFDECYASHKFAARVDADVAEGQRYGVRGTPHFFVNGRPINGAQPFDVFKQAIDEELAKKKS